MLKEKNKAKIKLNINNILSYFKCQCTGFRIDYILFHNWYLALSYSGLRTSTSTRPDSASDPCRAWSGQQVWDHGAPLGNLGASKKFLDKGRSKKSSMIVYKKDGISFHICHRVLFKDFESFVKILPFLKKYLNS